MVVLGLLGGLLLLTLSAEVLIRGAVWLATRLGLSPLVVGLTVVAFGTSAPELAVSVQAALEGSAAIALGNVLGSNVFNVFLILGVAGLIQPLVVQESLVRREVPLVLLVTGGVWALAAFGTLGAGAGAAMVTALILITTYQVRTSRAESARGADPAPEVGGRLWRALLGIGAGLCGLVLGARWFVDAAIELSRAMGVSESVIAATLVAGGTSLPELATSVLAAARGQRDIAVGNVIGSNLFNLLGVLGTAMLVGGPISPPAQSLAVDFPAAGLAALLCLPFLMSGRRLDRKEAAAFVALYVAYVAVLL